MLRLALLLAAALSMLAGVVGLLFGCSTWRPALLGAGLLACALFERRHYRSAAGASEGNWQATGEVFIDPESGQALEVLYDPDSGERRYVPAQAPSSGPGPLR